MKNAYKSGICVATFALIGAFGLSGCASTVTANKPEDHLAAASDRAKKSAVATSKENIPNAELSDDIFFKVISAEIAFQRGEFSAAFATTMAVAKQTRDPRLAKRAMEMALLVKQPGQAFVAARLWYEYSPNSDEATQYYLGFMIVNNNLDEVKSIIASRLAVVTTPKDRGLLLQQTQRLLLRAKDKQAAFRLLEELCKPYSDYLEAHLALAQAAHANNDNTRALAQAQLALQIDPSSQTAALVRAQASPSTQAAIASLSQFLKHNPTANEVRRAYAGLLIEQKQFSDARHELEILVVNKPNDASILYALGLLALQLNDLATAEKYLTQFVKFADASADQKSDPTSAYVYLSQMADDRKDGDKALDWLSKIQSYDGKNAAWFDAQLRRALLISKYKSLEEAQQFLQALNATTPEEKVRVIQLQSELLREKKRDIEALGLLQAATKSYPDNSDLFYDFAMLAEKLDRLQDAETALRRVLQLAPDNAQAYNALGYLFTERNIRLAEARVLLEKALSLAPNDAFILDSMGWLEFRENHPETALEFLRRAYQIRPEADIAVHIGEVLWAMGELEKARAIWKKAQQQDPHNASLKSTLKRLNVSF